MEELETKLRTLLEPEISRLGYELVRLAFHGGKDKVLQIMAETADGLCGIGDCQTISRALSQLLDERDPIPFPYRLEVSSPGIDRPLTRPKDFTRWAGHRAKIETRTPVDGRKRVEGTLEGLGACGIGVKTSTGVMQIPLDNLKSAKLVLTDALLAATKPQQHIMQQENDSLEGVN